MKELEQARKRYDEIPVPGELQDRIRRAEGDARAYLEARQDSRKPPQSKLRGISHRRVRKGLWAAAAAMAVFVTALNTSTVFAQEVGKIPVIGAVARVFTFRTDEQQQDGI